MTTREAIQFARTIAQGNGDNLVFASLCIIEAQLISGEIGEVAELLCDLARKKIAEHTTEFPMELS